ncbi:MAG TPA: cyclic nucleotide-binding domain-containing protein, partial [Candidatus Limnocylindrales bacterium]|nr:cyclic nucleotide-binding domain-containing protein [Candidatus Limnocylindrales bacterium]
AILVYAFNRGGATETGVAALVQLAPSAMVAPLAASIGDHVRRERALLLAYLLQGGTMGLTAAALLLQAPSPLVYLAAACAATSITLTRPVQAAILPSLSRTPSELTAANVTAGAIETGAMLVGPIAAGLALAVIGSGAVFAGAAAVTLIGALLVSGTTVLDMDRHLSLPASGWRGALPEALDGFRLLVREREPRAVLAVLGAAAMLWGALDVFIVVLALDVLALGESGVGYLNAALGAGGLAGAALSLALIGRRGLSTPLGVGILLWSVPLAAIGLLSSTPAVIGLLVAAGLGRVVMDVAGRTLLQRVAHDHMLSRLFGLLEGVHMGSLAIGSIAAPAMIALTGERGAFLVAGSVMLLAAALVWPVLRRLDAAAVARPRELALLRGIPMFAPLGQAAIERLAAGLVPVHAHLGSLVVRQGEPGQHFYIITHGRVAISIDGRHIRDEGPGESFGEIALLRNVPRTASVEALVTTELVALERRVFLEAVTGLPASSSAAEGLVEQHLNPPAPAPRTEEPSDARA